MQWISVLERLPEVGEMVVVVVRTASGGHYTRMDRLQSDGHWWKVWPNDRSLTQVTHWLKLPPIPQQYHTAA